MNVTMELLIMKLRSEAEEIYLSKECKEKVIQESVIEALKQNLSNKKISSAEYEEALDILKRNKLR